MYLIGLRETIRLSGDVKCFCHEVYSHVVPNSESFGNLSFPSSCSLFGLTLPSPHPLLTSARHLSPGRPCVCCLVCPDVPSSETLQDTLVGCTFHFNHTLCFPKAVNLNKSGFLHERVVIVYVLTSHVMDLSFRRFSGTDQEGGSNDWDIRLWLLGDRLL